jgi:tape measure domain-containing protein
VAVATVDIQVNSQGAVSSIRNVNAAASQLENQINNTNRSVKQLETAFAGLGVAIAGMNALNIAKDFFATANAADTAQRRIKLVSQGLDDYRVVLQTTKDAANKFGLSQTQASQAIADIYTRLRPVGFSLSAINAIYEGFNTAVKLSGVEAGAASAAFLQLSQGLGSGTLQGDELRSVLEQMPSIAQAIAKELDISVGSIKKFGSEGKITSDVIVRALDRIRTEGSDKLAQSLDTPQQRIVDLQNAFEEFKVVVASSVAPTVVGAIELITDAIERATQFVENLKTGFGLLASAFSGIGSGIGSIKSALDGTIGKFAALGQSKGLMMLLNFLTLGGAGALNQLAAAGAKKNASKPFAAPIGPEIPVRLAMVGMDFGGGAGKKGKRKGKSAEERAAEKAAREAARLREETQKQLDSASRLSDLAEANLEIQVSSNAEERLKSEFDKASIERRMRFIDLQKEAKSEQERELLTSAQLSEILIANNKYAKDKKDILEQQTKELYSQLGVSGILDKTLQNRLSGAFIGGTATGGFRTDINLDPNKQAGKVQEYVNQAKKDLADVQGKIVSLATTVESSIGSAMSNAISGVLQGTATVKDAFASMFKSIGDAFIQMATQMIAKALIMKVLGILGGAFGGGGGIGANNYSSAFSGGAAAFNPGAFSGGMSFFANGGFVNSPTNAIIGEGGQPEYVIPASKMRESMSRYAAGARGSAVIGNGTSDGDLGGGAATMNGSTIDVRYTVERINSVDYVTASQFQQGMQKAAMEGAQRGQQATLRRLQNSSSTRRSVGI